MNCHRCKDPMIVTVQEVQASSTQTWYECATCARQRLLSAETSRYVAGSGQSLASRYRAESPDAATESYRDGTVAYLR